MKTNKKFNRWLKQIGREMTKRGVREYYPKYLAQSHWQDYYDDGFTPQDALAEDLSYTDCD